MKLQKKLNKEYKTDKLAMVADIKPNYERLPSGSRLSFGFLLGRICVFSNIGKCSACAVLAYQRKFPQKICAYVDVEHS